MVGPLFRQRAETTERREIIVLLTPRIVDEPSAWEEGESYADQFYDRLDVFRDKMNPLGKRALAERSLRLARAAWAAGDALAALRHVNRSIHFDPLNQAAVNLREEVLAVAPDLEVRVDEHLHRGLALPIGRDYSKQGYPWQRFDHEIEPYVPDTHETIRMSISDGPQ